ncbi:hypothetical protein V865_002849 [Kwoniella europaea PYCC6329]|uniref:Protein kinase domain-containing protein n=1 Tax=Kwoniella europaea PYCC6329 TaxID=1423913 RepID=A0AAX4KH86_9TREE
MPFNPLPSGYTFNPYVSSLQPDQVYLAGVFLSQIVNFTTRPQSLNPFDPLPTISTLVFPDWVLQEVQSGVLNSLPPDLFNPDGVTLLLQCSPEFAEQLHQQAQIMNQTYPELMYFGWGRMPISETPSPHSHYAPRLY